jgi:carboxyl-terminal processing protease
VDLANLFLDKGLITYSQGQKSPRKNYDADAKKDITALPLVVLTNRGTAAAAEVAAAALQGDKRASLVGERTYGDASVLHAITMDDGSAIILSIAKYYSPDGKSIQDNGVTPEDLVADSEAPAPDADDDDDAVAPNPGITGAPRTGDQAKKPGQAAENGKSGDDVILQKAIEIAQKKG